MKLQNQHAVALGFTVCTSTRFRWYLWKLLMYIMFHQKTAPLIFCYIFAKLWTICMTILKFVC